MQKFGNSCRKKIGLYFGSFNPIHNGHVVAARTVLEQVCLDEVWFVVSPKNPLKDTSVLCDEQHRFNMVDLVILFMDEKERVKYSASNVEFDMPKPSYTINTIDKLKSIHPNADFHVMIGSDILPCFKKWKCWKRIISENILVVMNRPGYELDIRLDKDFSQVLEELGSYRNVILVNTQGLLKLSSTYVRERVKKGLPISFLVPNVVDTYIRKYRLFISNEGNTGEKDSQ